MSQPLFEQRVDWTDWAEHAAERQCAAGCGPFRPNHPRRQFCQGPGCPGRKPAKPRQRRQSGRAQAQARAAGVQGFIGDVLTAAQRVDLDPTTEAVGQAFLTFVRAEKSGDAKVARAAAVQLCALGAAHAVLLMPPAPDAS